MQLEALAETPAKARSQTLGSTLGLKRKAVSELSEEGSSKRKAPEQNLLKELQKLWNLTWDNKDFYLESELPKVFTVQAISAELHRFADSQRLNEGHDHVDYLKLKDQRTAKKIHDDLLKTFATLVLLGQPELIIEAVNQKHTEGRDPMTKQQAREFGFPKQFYKLQYRFYPVLFSEDNMKDTYDTQYVIPITSREPIKGAMGGFGTIYAITIHPKCDEIKPFEIINHEGESQNVYACKEQSDLEIGDRKQINIESFLHEIVRGGSSPDYRYIMPMLAKYSQNGVRYMIFPKAESDLATFMEGEPPDTDNEKVVLLERVSMLARALSAVHNLNKDPKISKRFKDTESIVCHRDISTRNVLILDNKFMLSDFGMARIMRAVPGMTPAYKWDQGSMAPYLAPECRDGTDAGRKSDIWALGCLFTDFLIFVLRGKEYVAQFLDARMTFRNKESKTDPEWMFFERSDPNDKTGRVKVVVLQWLQELEDSPEKGPGLKAVVHGFVCVIKKMLRVGGEFDIGVVVRDLKEVFRRIDNRGGLSPRPATSPILRPFAQLPPTRNSTLSVNGDEALASLADNCDTVFLIHNTSVAIERHWKHFTDSLTTLASNAMIFDDNGIDIYFTGPESPMARHEKRRESIIPLMEDAKHRPAASEKAAIRKIDNFISNYIRAYDLDRRQSNDHHKDQRRLNMIVLSTGEFSINEAGQLDRDLSDIVIRHVNNLHQIFAPVLQVGIQFVVLNRPRNSTILEKLEELDNMAALRDIVDVTEFDNDIHSRDMTVVKKILCGSQDKRLDNSDRLNVPAGSTRAPTHILADDLRSSPDTFDSRMMTV